jgi:hypothetical protein
MTTRIALALFFALPAVSADRGAAQFKNVVVYQEPGRFGGWPANQGIWSWGNEIVVGLRSAIFKVNPVSHAVDNALPGTSRSLRPWSAPKTVARSRSTRPAASTSPIQISP